MSRSRADKLGRGIGANTHRHFERIRKAVAVRRGNRELKGFSHRRRAVDAARVSIKAQPAVIGQPVNPEGQIVAIRILDEVLELKRIIAPDHNARSGIRYSLRGLIAANRELKGVLHRSILAVRGRDRHRERTDLLRRAGNRPCLCVDSQTIGEPLHCREGQLIGLIRVFEPILDTEVRLVIEDDFGHLDISINNDRRLIFHDGQRDITARRQTALVCRSDSQLIGTRLRNRAGELAILKLQPQLLKTIFDNVPVLIEEFHGDGRHFDVIRKEV